MFRLTRVICLFAFAIVFTSSFVCLAQQTMDNAAVMKLKGAGLSDELIVQTINASQGHYDTSTDSIVQMKKDGVSENIIGAMIAKNSPPVTAPLPTSSLPNPTPDSSSNASPVPPTPLAPLSLQGARIFIAPMQGNLDGFLAAEILKQKVPFVVVSDDKQADLVMTGMNVKEDDHWYNAAWGGKDKNEGSVRVVQIQNKAMVWAGDAGDRTMLFSIYHRGGLSKVAERLVKQLNKDLFKK